MCVWKRTMCVCVDIVLQLIGKVIVRCLTVDINNNESELFWQRQGIW